MKAKKYLIIAAIIVVIISAYFIYQTFTENKNVDQNDKTVRLKFGSISNLFKVNGTLLPAKIVEVQSPLTGEIINLRINEGDSVVINQILAEIKPDPKIVIELMQKENNLLSKKLKYENNKKLYRDNKNLFNKNMIREDEFKTKEMEFIILEKDYKLAQMAFDLFIKENGFNFRSSDEIINKNSYLRSPISGIVLENFATTGMFVKSAYSQYSDGTVICSIGDLSEYVVDFSVNEIDYNKLYLNQEAEVTIPENDSLKDSGRITQISPMANYEEKPVTFDARLTFIPKSAKEYFPGMTVELSILIEKKDNIFYLPIEALIGTRVIVKEKNGPDFRRIAMGISDNNYVEIISGLEQDEEVYLNAKEKFKIFFGYR